MGTKTCLSSIQRHLAGISATPYKGFKMVLEYGRKRRKRLVEYLWSIMNHLLSNDFQAFEVDNALKQMFLTIAPGPDGMPPVFY